LINLYLVTINLNILAASPPNCRKCMRAVRIMFAREQRRWHLLQSVGN